MKRSFSIIGGRVIDPAGGLDQVTDIHLEGRKVLALGPAPEGFQPQQQLDAHGLWVFPGVVDLSVRLREPGAEHKATVASETRAAACNGITTVCCPPDTDPVLDTAAVAELLQRRAKQTGMSRVVPLAALTQGLQGQQLSEMYELKQAGCVGVSNAIVPVENTEVLRNAYAYAASCGLTVFIQPRDPWLGRRGSIHESGLSTRLGLTGIPESTETIAIARDLELIELTGVRAHFCRLSSARSVELLRQARERGLPVSADVSAHQLFLTEMDSADYNSLCHVYPPLRGERDRQALRQALLDGVIEAVCSDHQPHEADAKLSPFALTEPGVSSLDTLLPLALRAAAETGLEPARMLACLSQHPARILGLDTGSLAPGQFADLCVYDPARSWSVSPASLYSHRHNSPFMGWEMQGRAVHTFVRGKLIFSADSAE